MAGQAHYQAMQSAVTLRSALLCSDVHLCEESPALTRLFLEWLRRHTLGSEAPPAGLLILGDLFDAWVGDDCLDHPLGAAGRAVCQTLNEITKNGIAVFFMHGNRDFLIGSQFCQRSGARLLSDPTRLTIEAAGVIALAHGDAQCSQDTDYQVFRRQIRTAEWQAAFLAKPMQERMQIAAELRMQSETEKSQKSMMLMDVSLQDCELLTQTLHADLMLHGHTHRPGCSLMGNGKARWVLSDWEADPDGQLKRGGGLWVDASGVRPLL